MKRGLRVVISVLALVTTIILSYISVGAVGSEVTSDSNLQDKLRYWPMIVISGSMEPTMMTNSISICQTASIDDIEVGDIVLFEWNNERVVHRCIERGFSEKRQEEYIRTKGDNNELPDDVRVYNNMIKGKVVRIYNEVVPIMNRIMLPDGNGLDIVVISKYLVIFVIILSLLLWFIEWFRTFFIELCLAFISDKYYSKELKKYLDAVDSSKASKEKLKSYNKSDGLNIIDRYHRAKVMKDIKIAYRSIRSFNNKIKRIK